MPKKMPKNNYRYCMVVLRELMDQRRATIPTEAEAAAKKAAEEAEAKAAAEAEAAANAAPVKSLVECLTEAKLNDKMILRQFDKWLKGEWR
jgi:regulator of protease activity HflC (stomatin/prohibitin superfamily)